MTKEGLDTFNDEANDERFPDSDTLINSIIGGLNTNNPKYLMKKLFSIPLKVLKLSKYYYSIKIDTSCGNFTSIQRSSVNGKKISGSSYIHHLALNRKYKKLYDDILVAHMYGLNILNKKLPTEDKFMNWLVFNDNKIEFFVDYQTVCRVTNTKCTVDIINEKIFPIIKIEFIGLNAYKYYHNLYEICTYNKPSKMNNQLNKWSRMSVIKPTLDKNDYITLRGSYIKVTSFDNIITENGKISEIKNELELFIESENIYNKYQINNSLGILLYGIAGTGKTSIIKSIIDYTRDMILNNSNYVYESVKIYSLDVSKDNNFITQSIDLINNDIGENQSYSDQNVKNITFVIIEEIDSVMNKSRDNDQGEVNAKIKTLLEFLDGISTPSDSSVIFLASTNYYDRLDPALIRDGRFDLTIELKPFHTQEIVEMCKLYGVDPDKLFKDQEYKNPDYIIIPSSLQNKLIKYIIENLQK